MLSLEFFGIFIFTLMIRVRDPGFIPIIFPIPESWQVLQRNDFNKNREMKNKTRADPNLHLVTRLSKQPKCLYTVIACWNLKRLKGFCYFGIVDKKLPGVFFRRAEGKLEPTFQLNKCTLQETINGRFPWKRKNAYFLSPCSPCHSKMCINHGECWLK